MIEPAIQRFYRSVEWSWLLELREAERRDGGGDADTIATRLDPDHTRAALHLNRWLRWRVQSCSSGRARPGPPYLPARCALRPPPNPTRKERPMWAVSRTRTMRPTFASSA